MQKQKLMREFSCFALVQLPLVGEDRTIHFEEARPEEKPAPQLKSPTGSPRPEDLEALQKEGAFATAPGFTKLARWEREARDPISIIKRQFDREALTAGLKENLSPLGKSFLNEFKERVDTLQQAARYIEPHLRNANVEVHDAAEEAKNQIAIYGLAFEPKTLPIVLAALYEKIGPLLGITPRDVKNGTAQANSDEYASLDRFWPFKNPSEWADYSIKRLFAGAPDYVTSDSRAKNVVKASLASLINAEQQSPEIATRVVDEFVLKFGTVWGTIEAERQLRPEESAPSIASDVASRMQPAEGTPELPAQPPETDYAKKQKATARIIAEAADPKNRPDDQIQNLWAMGEDITDPAKKVVPGDRITELRVKPGKSTFIRNDKGDKIDRLTSGAPFAAVGDERHVPYGPDGIRFVKVNYKDKEGYDQNGWVSWKNAEPISLPSAPSQREKRQLTS